MKEFFLKAFTQIFLFIRLAGSSGPCQTFGNTCLAHDSGFELKNVEVLLLYLRHQLSTNAVIYFLKSHFRVTDCET